MWLVKHVARGSRKSDWRGYFLIACITVLALLLAGASWSAWKSSIERTQAEEWQVHTLEVLLESDRLRTASLQMLRGERGFLLTGDEEFLEPYDEGKAEAEAALPRLATLTRDNAEQQIRIGRLEKEFDQLNLVLSAMLEQERTGRHEEALFFVKQGNGREAIESILGELDGIEATERQLLAERTAVAGERATSNERYQYALAILGLALLALALLATIYVRRALSAESEARRELQRFASTDALTNLPNRRSLMEALGRSIERAAKDRARKLALAIFDIDHFKQINDRFGHPAGDEVIREVGVRALDSLRKRDLVGRIGGEEFAVILPAAELQTARDLCERLRTAIAEKPVRAGDAIIPFTVSIGVAEFGEGDDMDRLMARADKALYEAKSGGRDKVCLAA